MVVMDQFTRRIIGFAVHAGNVDGPAVCRMFNEIIAGQDVLPSHLSSDHDPLFEFRQWSANLRILDVNELKTVPYVPLSHPFVERLIGTIRRELLDHALYWTTGDLELKLRRFQKYYNRHRIHASLADVTPDSKAENTTPPVANLRDYRWRSHCRDLYQLPAAA
jgi:transposase InsO family protein